MLKYHAAYYPIEDGWFMVRVLDFPGVISQGRNMDQARKMIHMTQQINSNFQDNKMYVSCYTCHRGEAQPKTAPEPKASGL